ncbi:MAG TPA: prepilin-type N-terminal cleavage/methylation domain-containing protein [Terriglobales bacterium]|jgi:prepilin-type N-terminal cleavage/methylation domain-containing protein|nr:prepilin-type N-terminal cleavage/methylation domain-containing protein [Terriglobales bacterium]
MQGRRGFSWIELLVVILLLLVLALLFTPIVDRRIYANESSAVAAVHNIQSAQLKYAQTYPAIGFADNVAKLGAPPPGTQPNSNHANLLDPALACPNQPCARSGYLFAIDQTSGTPVTSFRITAVPVVPGKTGGRGFCVTGLGIISTDPAGGKACSVPIR